MTVTGGRRSGDPARTARRRVRLAVLGSPIAHSKSPALHRAAYAALGLDWSYDAIDTPAGTLGDLIARVRSDPDAAWRGLSLTMPLKREVLDHLDGADRLVDLAGAANTLRFADDGTLQGFNTDIGGIVGALGHGGVDRVHRAVLLGGGATAASALIAMAELGAAEVDVLVRDPSRALGVVELGRRVGLVVRVGSVAELSDAPPADLLVSTVPGGTDLGVAPSAALVEAAVLLDVAYDPWPTPLASDWLDRGGRLVHGLGMLVHQALLQVRVFTSGDPLEPLPDEESVLDVMRRSA
ncbi:shikimate dehydrogenase [Agromyces sp. SYSU T0242]|uniref:shikimate dehydrogenase n=1 Tax=Agromyces litoreus TaxID=3158561 RepID=UPI0033964916